MIRITYQNKSIQEILEDDEYPYQQILQSILKRIRNFYNYVEEIQEEDKILFQVRNMTFVTVEPLNEGVKVSTEFYYERIVDLVHKYDVQPRQGHDGTDIISIIVDTPINIQYSISLAQQSCTRFKRLKL